MLNDLADQDSASGLNRRERHYCRRAPRHRRAQLRHVSYLAGDPLVARLTGLTRLPAARTIGRWLGQFRTRHLRGLAALNAELVAAAIEHLGLPRLIIDVDGSVVSTGLTVAWAHRGYNPHRRKVPSYYPITAYEAQSGQILRVQNRLEGTGESAAALDAGQRDRELL